jgi:hypothetical protein
MKLVEAANCVFVNSGAPLGIKKRPGPSRSGPFNLLIKTISAPDRRV